MSYSLISSRQIWIPAQKREEFLSTIASLLYNIEITYKVLNSKGSGYLPFDPSKGFPPDAIITVFGPAHNWTFGLDLEGNIISIESSGADSGGDIPEFLEKLASYFPDKSYVEIKGDDWDDLFRLYFLDGKVIEVEPEIKVIWRLPFPQ